MKLSLLILTLAVSTATVLGRSSLDEELNLESAVESLLGLNVVEAEQNPSNVNIYNCI